MKTVSKQTQNTVINLSSKFTKGYNRIAANDPQHLYQDDKNTKTKSVRNDVATAGKIVPLDEISPLNDTLLKIYSFLKTNSEEDTKHREKLNNFQEEKELEAKKRHDKLMKAITALMDVKEGTATKVDNDKTPNGGPSIGDIVANVAGGSALSKALPGLATAGVVGGVAVGGAAASMIATSILASEQGKPLREAFEGKQDPYGTLGAMSGDTAVAAAALSGMEETTENAINRKKANLLADRPSNKKSLLFWKDSKLQGDYLKEVGWDEKSGTTKAERQSGVKSIDAKGQPVMGPVPTAIESPTPETPAPTKSTPSSAAPVSSTPSSSKVNEVTSENNKMRVEEMTSPAAPAINTVNKTVAQDAPARPERVRMPAVRNLEETFQKMIIYSTRVV
jgi:hypothetical protein